MSENGQGSAGNVIAALCSLIVPGLGQLIQGRLMKAAFMFVLAAVLLVLWVTAWVVPLVTLWSVIDAAMFKPRS